MPAPRKPTSVLQLAGSFKTHPERARDAEPEAAGEIGEPPETFTEMEKKAWNQIVGDALDGVFCKSDRLAVELASKLLAGVWENGLDDRSTTQLRQFLAAFGMTPADRSRISVQKKNKVNPFAELMGAA